ncbi:thioesterase domain-containing protein [Anaeromicropila populeti]|uniref:Thioesterase domain-containing protein n=1 Tax=Anaeromicropila populeti TaxID=37658 RepID=A0A1I6JXG5_9FIRM|nr:thioesterase domain-containing protein [Anaeromicropila populeti]SFR83662.1 Thioesterase domain-containing protein [Anaeromicropila populeti]
MKKESFVVLAEGKNSSEKMQVLFPGGIGTLTQFQPLLSILENRFGREEAIAGFQITDYPAFLEEPAEQLIANLGQKYAKVLLEKEATSYELIGYCFGGLAAMECARRLKDAGKMVKQVITIDTLPNETMLDSDLLMERSLGLFLGSDAYQAGHTVGEELLREALVDLSEKNHGFITTEALCALREPFEEVSACYRKLAEKSHEERLKGLMLTAATSTGKISEEELQQMELMFRIFKHTARAVWEYQPCVYNGDALVLSCADKTTSFLPPMKITTEAYIRSMTTSNFVVRTVEGNHGTCVIPPYVSSLADAIMGGSKL